ncbi:MAG: flagellar type III secretion system pore protein FliP [Zetaproteobacteria bacterium]|nr:flagellar type III secretion system pore protein FliP [Zetaproteobacteria bacterium]
MYIWQLIVGICCFVGWVDSAWAVDIPRLTIGLEGDSDPDQFFTGLKILAFLTVLTLAPSILVMMTSFTRIIVVFSFLKMALGTQQSPPSQVLIGLALFLTLFIMMPTWQAIDRDALTPYLNETINQSEAFEKAQQPLREFMLKHTREDDLVLFLQAAKQEQIEGPEQTPMHVLIPAFMISELRTAFEIGFLIYLPFIVIDMVVASVLMSMGMMMLPPMMISLPMKIVLFVLVDGWHLLSQSLIASYA